MWCYVVALCGSMMVVCVVHVACGMVHMVVCGMVGCGMVCGVVWCGVVWCVVVCTSY